MNNCLILFLISIILWLIAKIMEKFAHTNKYVVDRYEKKFIRFCELCNLFLESTAIIIYYTTLILGIYIFLFIY